jgi:hypothetical protein
MRKHRLCMSKSLIAYDRSSAEISCTSTFRLPNPEKLAQDEKLPWLSRTLALYGELKQVQYKELVARWYRSAGKPLLKAALVRGAGPRPLAPGAAHPPLVPRRQASALVTRAVRSTGFLAPATGFARPRPPLRDRPCIRIRGRSTASLVDVNE